SLEQSSVGVRVKRGRVRLIERIRAVTRKRTAAQPLRAVQTRFRQSCPQRCREVREYSGWAEILQRLWSARIPQGQNGFDGVSALPAVEDERMRTAVQGHRWIRRRRATARFYFCRRYRSRKPGAGRRSRAQRHLQRRHRTVAQLQRRRQDNNRAARYG